MTNSQPTILITGGAGFIGSHTVLEFLNADYNIIVLDDLSNSSKVALTRVQALANKSLTFIEGDIHDTQLLEKILTENTISMVVHFAAFKAVGESAEKPLEYYRNNVTGTISLLQVMDKMNVRKFVFSSSATVYGEPDTVPITEEFPLKQPANPYGRTKKMVEEILFDLYASDNRWSIALLRYFNPVGAHESGEIGEDPNGIPNNLVPFVTQVAIGKREKLSVFGDDYPTVDGTGVRDYIHVVDLAGGHLAAANYLFEHENNAYVWNLGTGLGCSVLQVIKAFEKANGVTIPYQVTKRRDGDIAEYWSDSSKAQQELQWHAKRDLTQMMRDAWNWQQKNPDGYPD